MQIDKDFLKREILCEVISFSFLDSNPEDNLQRYLLAINLNLCINDHKNSPQYSIVFFGETFKKKPSMTKVKMKINYLSLPDICVISLKYQTCK